MTSAELAAATSTNLRSLADRIDAGKVSVSRLTWTDTGKVVIYGPAPFDKHREVDMTVRFIPEVPDER
jgi:hypothetical protein